MSLGNTNDQNNKNHNYPYQRAVLELLKTINVSVGASAGDRLVLGQEELTLTNVAKAFPFTGINSESVGAVEIRVRKSGVPTDSTHIARFTMYAGSTPTASHGMYLGDGDLYTITNNTNCVNTKLISTDGTQPICNIVYYSS